MFNLDLITRSLSETHIDAWLLTDFQKTNSPARELLAIPDNLPASRRWFYLLRIDDSPLKIVHAIEPGILDHLPGETRIYSGRQPLIHTLKELLKPNTTIAMEYSPLAEIPNASRVDAGTVELIRSLGPVIVSSANLLQCVTARWGETGLTSHRSAARALIEITREVWRLIRNGSTITEPDVRHFIMDQFASRNLITDHPPICAVNAHAADPHFEPTERNTSPIAPNSLVLIDLWAKTKDPDAVFADITWTAYTGESVPDIINQVASIVFDARNAALECVRSGMTRAGANPVTGADADRACREVIERNGFGAQFIHRTGHSLGRTVHGPGANLDSFESIDTRPLIPDTGFTIEPGIYLPGRFGIRSEINVAMTPVGGVEVTTLPLQNQVVPILA